MRKYYSRHAIDGVKRQEVGGIPYYLNINSVWSEVNPDKLGTLERADKLMIVNFLYDYCSKAELVDYIHRTKECG